MVTIRSMTGFGFAEVVSDGLLLKAEIRTVNHRSLDIRIKAPAELWSVENDIRQVIKAGCGRGRVECQVSLTQESSHELHATTLEGVQELYNKLISIQQWLGLKTKPTLADLLQAGADPGQISLVLTDATQAALRRVVTDAVASLVASREAEGSVLREEMEQRLVAIEQRLTQIEAVVVRSMDAYESRLRERIMALLQKRDLGEEMLSEERLHMEVALLVDRADITEEVVRARCHVEAIQRLLQTELPPGQAVGKRVDFFLQELNREANTMASKSASADLTAEVVEIKHDVERLREQIQNVE